MTATEEETMETPVEPRELYRKIVRLGLAHGNGDSHNGNGNGSGLSLREMFGDVPGITRPMTYEEYLDGPVDKGRYDILDGWKVYYTWGRDYMPSPNRRHQRILSNVHDELRLFEKRARTGYLISAPSDVQITQRPARSRQPDLLFISRDRWKQNPPFDTYNPLNPAPELVVEVFSRSDRGELASKIADYRRVDVLECWIVHPDAQTIELLALSRDAETPLGTFGIGSVVESRAFPGLVVNVADIFTDLEDADADSPDSAT